MNNLLNELNSLKSNLDNLPIMNLSDLDLNNTDLLDKEYKKEELIKLSKEGSHTPFAICFYLEAPENIEGPISARVNYI